MMGGGSIKGENKNTSASCWRSRQMCFRAEYAEHIQTDKIILAYSVAKVYWQNKQKDGICHRKEVK